MVFYLSTSREGTERVESEKKPSGSWTDLERGLKKVLDKVRAA